ncbi:MAG: GNAT family N-acetyltransferase [Sedimentisphaerales bacterium]|nr:GNAT family N-acetyltransferase [Sedimentisphaerales bacterium]
MARPPQSREAVKRKPPSRVEPMRTEVLVSPAPVRVRTIEPGEITEAVRLLLGGSCPAEELPAHIKRFFVLAEQENYDLNRQIVVEAGGRLTYSCLFVPRPGRMSYIFTARPGRNPREAAKALQQLGQWAFRDGSRFLQILLEPNQPQRAELSLQAGYRRLTDLHYLGRFLSGEEFSAEVPVPDIDWLDYDDTYREFFRRTIAQTYQQSLDCPELEQIRSLEDTFSGFLQVCGPERRYWRLLRYQEAPAGVLLLTRLKKSELMELTYMGICPAWRGRGLGRRLLEQALRTTKHCGAEMLTLAVDQRNYPARRLYQQFGFNELLVRQVFYTTP